MKMSKKLDFVNKNTILSTIIVFAVLCIRGLYEYSQLGKLQTVYVVYVVAACAALTVFLFFELMPNISKEINAAGAVGIIGFVYLVVVGVSEYILNYDALAFLISISVILLLTRNIWMLIAATCGSIVLAAFFNHAAIVCIPAFMGASFICFAPLFKKERPLSKKQAKKVIRPEQPEDKKKEKIIFAVCQSVMLVLTVYTCVLRRYTVTAAAFKYNLKFYFASVIVFALMIAFAVLAIKNKRGYVEAAGYLIPVVFMPMMILAEHTVAANSGTAMLFMLLIMCSRESLAAELAEKAFDAVREKLPKKAETD